MTALLTDNLTLLAGAPNGIKKLRELILELAVRGKLVPQVSNDEPASELLKRIAEEMACLVAEGKTKKQNPLSPIGDEEKSFDLPEGWAWQRFGEIFSLEYGDNLPADKRSNTGEYPVYGSNGVVGTHNKCFVSSPCIVVGRKGSAGALNLCVAQGCCVTDVAYYCIPPSACVLDYVFKLFHTLGLDSLGKGIKPGLNRNEAYELVVAVPPFSEQYRIVAKVDELMALCDRLEAQQADAESAHAQLVQALLDSLTQASDATDFAANWQRLAEHFHTLFTTEPSIDALKQTLLQLAVMGKLVPQDPSDEPASELLKRIAEEKERLLANGDLKRQKSAADATNLDMVDNLPKGWEFVSLSSVSTLITDGTHQTPKYVSSGRPFLSAQNVKPFKFMPESHRFVSPEDFDSLRKNRTPELGDILMTRVGAMIGEAAVIDQEIDFAFYVSLALIKLPKKLCSAKFIVLWLNSPLGTALSIKNTLGRGVSAGNLNLGLIRNFHFGFPPLSEQHRIVAKVDQLMALCDQLKTRLTQARQFNEQLASTLVEQAVA